MASQDVLPSAEDIPLDLGKLFAVEPDLIGLVAKFADIATLSRLSLACKACAKYCQPELERQRTLLKLTPRPEGTRRFFTNIHSLMEEKCLAEDYVEVSAMEGVMGRSLAEMRAFDYVQLLDYRGCGAYVAVPRGDRLVLRSTGGEFGYCLPWEAYDIVAKDRGISFFERMGFVRYIHVPSTSELFAKYASHRPSSKCELFMSFDCLGDPFDYDELPDENGDRDTALFWDFMQSFWWKEDDEERDEDDGPGSEDSDHDDNDGEQ